MVWIPVSPWQNDVPLNPSQGEGAASSLGAAFPVEGATALSETGDASDGGKNSNRH